MKKISFIILFLLFINSSVIADVYDYPSNLKSISNQIPKMGSVKCKFRQEKYLKNVSRPIISYGDFEFVENKGIYFYTVYPLVSTVNYTNKNYKQINDIVEAISSKKYSKLENEFNFYFNGNNNKWILGMKPKKSSNVINYISSITINGSDYIHKINILQTNGNNTILWFTK